MDFRHLQKGDAVYAATTIANDGSVPNTAENEIFAQPGAMGMLLNTGHLEDDPEQEVYLVSFKNEQGDLGPPVSCLAHEITLDRIK